MKIKNLLLSTAFLCAVISSFAFKARSSNFNGSVWSPGMVECDGGMLIDDDCHAFGEGARCTIYYDDDHPTEPAFIDYHGSAPNCLTPLYHQF